jgi:hypothetical protein
MGCALGILGCEAAFWPTWSRELIAGLFQPVAGVLDARTLAGSLAVLAVGNAVWTLRVILGRRTFAVRPGVLLTLALLSAAPFLGLLVIPLWRRLEARRPSWLVGDRKRSGTIDRPASLGTGGAGLLGSFRATAAAARKFPRRLEEVWIPILWLGPGNLLWVMVATAWLAAGATRPTLSPGALLALTGSLHLLAFAAARLGAPEPQLLEPSIRRRRRLELLWLLPSPLPQAWFFAVLKVGLNARRDASLAHAALLGRGFSRGSPTGAHLAERVRTGWSGRPAWQRWLRPAGPGGGVGLDAAAQRYLAVTRWKTVGLAVDGFALAAALGASNALPTATDQPLPGWVWAFFKVAVLIIGLAVLLWGAQQVARRLDVGGLFAVLDRQPYLRTVALGQLSLTLGLFWGISAALGDAEPFILALAYGWALAVALVAGGTFLNPTRLPGTGRRDPRDPWFWLLSLTATPLLLLAVVWLGGGPGSRTAVAGLAVAASLGWSAAVVCAGRSALLHPLEPRHLGDPSTPRAIRASLGFVLGTAALPLGGLLVPAWMALRERCRAAMDTVAATAAREVPCRT